MGILFSGSYRNLYFPCSTTTGRPLHKRLIDKGSELEGEEETAPEKRLRLAKEYLVQLEEEGGSCGSACVLAIVLLKVFVHCNNREGVCTIGDVAFRLTLHLS